MSSRYRPLLVLSAFILLTIAAYAQPLVMQPTISPDGSSVAFSYQGDIWTVPFAGGMARRLTIHEGYETNPRWTPDGAGIAFQSDRYGNFDIFLMSATGGMPTRLTYHDVADVMISVTPQGEILFNTDRIYAQVEREDEIYKASAQGGTPARFMDALGFDAVMSPDGSKVAFVRGTCRVAREAYRGPANRDIWIWDIQEDTYTQLTRFDGNEFAPQWIDDSNLLFISPKSGKYNVHRISLDGTESQVSNESEWGINSFSYSAGNQQIVYQGGDRVKSLPLSGGTATEMNIELNTDFRFDPLTNEDKTNNASQFAVSPDGDCIAYVHRGEIFVTRNDKKDSRSIRITNDPARDQHVTWLDDERLLFISDRNGQYDLFMAQSTDSEEANLFKSLKREVVLIKETPEEEFMPTISPDGKKIAFRRGRGQLITANISSNGQLSNEVTLQDGWATPQGMAWSPDSKWLAYGLTDLYFNQEIYIHAADGQSDPVNVSMHPKWDGNPVWSQDGSKLGFASMRNNGDMDVWFAWLCEEDWERSRESLKRAELEGEEKDTTQEFSIDIENIYQRLEQVTAYAGNESELSFSKEGDYIYYAIGGSGRQDFEIERNLYKIKWDGSDKKEILGGNKRPYGLTLNAKGSHIFYLSQGGKIGSVDLKSDKTEDQTTKSVYAIDRMAERDQVFEEGWRALNAGFYDPKFHGRDWEGLKAKYKPVAMKASTTEDFQYLYNLMLGQLDASHMGLRGSDDPKETQKDDTGLLGIEGEPVANGYRVNAVLAKSPAAKAESQLLVGDVITSIDQTPIGATTNLYELLNGRADNPVLLEINRDGEAMEIVIWPAKSLNGESYDDWVAQRQKLTSEYSNGRLGYLHIRGMNWTSFERFERELMAAGNGKEGIVIDVRYNGGGWTTDYLMAVLNVDQHAYTVPRGAAQDLAAENKNFQKTYPFAERLPLASWTKPSIAMCNENSYSNAEIFSHAYKHLDIGTLVGQPTFGAVISTGGWGLVDGSYVRMPFRAWYVSATGENMEHGPAVPDLIVANPPAYKARGIDPQLEQAVKTLLGQID